MDHAREGGCRCGRVRFVAAGAPLITMACHCTGCQRMTASAYSVSALYSDQAFSVTAGEPVIGGLKGATRHFFCPECMSWLFSRPEGLAHLVNVRSTLFDDPESEAPFIETYALEQLPWAATSASHSYERFPAPEDFPRLLAAYAGRSTGPAG